MFIVDKDSRAQIRQIETGISTETGYAVTSGLQPGETVIVSGTQKVRPGIVVQATPDPSSRPASPRP